MDFTSHVVHARNLACVNAEAYAVRRFHAREHVYVSLIKKIHDYIFLQWFSIDNVR